MGMGAELAFEHLEQGFLIGWWFRCRPPVVLSSPPGPAKTMTS
jgi:hypothetical protein